MQTQLVWRIRPAMALRQLGPPIANYGDLIQALRLRIEEIGSPLEAIDHVSGLAMAHTSKLVSHRRCKILGRISLTVLLETLGLQIALLVNDQVFEAKYRHRLSRARFARWHKPPPVLDCNEAKRVAGREMRVRVDDLGGVAAVLAVPVLREAVTVPAVPVPLAPGNGPMGPNAVSSAGADKPERPRFDPAARHPMPVVPRLQYARGRRRSAA